jgi:hypothetical protein
VVLEEGAFVVYKLPEDRMAEAEVSLRLAFHLMQLEGQEDSVSVAIDGAQVRVGRSQIFPIGQFLREHGWSQLEQEGKNPWQGRYESESHQLRVHSRSGEGDVVTRVGGKQVRAECKGGPLIKKPGSREYPKLRQALGQILTV